MAALKACPKTMQGLVERYLQWCRQRDLARGTLVEYGAMAKHLIAAVGDIHPSNLSHNDLEALYRDLLDRGYDPATVRKVHKVARAAFGFAEREEWVQRNPARVAKAPTKRRRKPPVPKREEVSRFLLWAKEADPVMYLYGRIIGALGLRPGEACAMRFDRIDFDTGILLVDSAQDCFGPLRIKDTKTHQDREVSIDTATLELLEKARANAPGPWVFGGAKRPWRRDTMSKWWKHAQQQAGTAFLVRHLRHYCATEMIASNELSPKEMADRLGHSVAMLFDTYGTSRGNQRAADVMGRVLD